MVTLIITRVKVCTNKVMTESSPARTVSEHKEVDETVVFGSGVQWKEDGSFLVFNDGDGKRAVYYADLVRKFSFTEGY